MMARLWKYSGSLLSLGVMLWMGGAVSAQTQVPSPELTALELNATELSTLEQSRPQDHSLDVSPDMATPDMAISEIATLEDVQASTLGTPGSSAATTLEPITSDPWTAESLPESSREGDVVAQTTIDPGRATRAGSSYIGVGGNIGFGGATALGRGNFSVFSKIGLTNTLSARPEVLISDEAAIILPVTVDFTPRSIAEGQLAAAPYIGGGVIISTGRGSLVRPLITGGIDVPLATQLTANAVVHVGFFNETEVGLRLGVGYNF